MSQKDSIQYPPGVRDLTEEISTDDLVRRLKDCAQAFQNMSQEEDNTAYIPLALYFASETFLEHRSQDVRLLVACCIADVFRVYAPEAPYKDVTQLKEIFELFVDQLKGLSNPQHASFKLYFYLLENLSCVKTFNICFEFEDNQKIISCLFKLMFKIINEQHNNKVRKFMIDMLCPLITEADLVPQELLDIIFSQIIEPLKTKNKFAFLLAQDILKRTASTLEPYIQHYFNNALILGRPLGDLSKHIFDLIYELNAIEPSMMVMVLPQLECKLKSGDEADRMQVTKAVAKMFADNKYMIDQNKSLWSSLLLRFNDISSGIRLLCVQHSKHFLLNHPESKEEITEQLNQRTRDPDEEIRFSSISTIVDVAAEDLDCVTRNLLDCVKDRTLDKKYQIRKVAVLGLAKIYKKYIGTVMATSLDSISWIKNKVLHMYYQTSLEDKLLVERIIHTCFIPYQKPMEERMKLLYQLYCSLDEHAAKAFKEILRCQKILRIQLKTLVENIQKEKSEARLKNIANKITAISKHLMEPLKAKQHLIKFCKELDENSATSKMLSTLLNRSITCSEADNKVKDILKGLGAPIHTNFYYLTIKQLLERTAPVMIDKESIKFLVLFVKDSLIDSCAIESELGLQNSAQSGLDLLLVLSYTFPHVFDNEEVYNSLMLFLQTEYEFAADLTLQILINVVGDLEKHFPDICSKLIPLLENFVETGSSKQAKHAVYCIDNIVSDKNNIFGKIIDNLKRHLTLESQYFRTALISIGHIAFLNSNMFATDLKAIITKIIHDLLMLDQDFPRGGTDLWGPLDSLPDETKCKIEGMKVMIRWLVGLKDFIAPATSTLNLFTNVLNKDGELGDRARGNNMAPMEKSWMRLSAASCILKLCQEPNYAPLVNLDTFLVLSNVMNDKCTEVADRFIKKLNKGLFFLKLPLEYLSMFVLAGFSNRKSFQDLVKAYLKSNISKRRVYLKEHNVSNEKLPLILPDYIVSYAVYLLAHSKVLTTYDDIDGLKKVKECLKLLLDCLMAKNENYSFPFFKRLLENMKQTKDKQSLPASNDTEEITKQKEEMNLKMYAVCDLALNIILSRPNHILKEFPAEPSLNSMFFTDPDKSYSNMKTYLPPELLENLKAGFEVEMFDSSKSINSASREQTTINSTNHSVMPSTSYEDLDTVSLLDEPNDSLTVPSPVAQRSTHSKRPRKESRNSESEASLPNNEQHSDNEADNLTCENSEMDLNHDETGNSEIVSKDSGISSSSVRNNARGRPRGSKATPKKSPQPSLRSMRSSRNSSLSTPSSLSEKNVPTAQQNGSSSPSTTSSCISNFQHLLKECNVCLSKDEVENYTAKKSPVREESSAKPRQRGRPRISKESPVKKRAETPTEDSSEGSLDNKSEASPIKNAKEASPAKPRKRGRPRIYKEISVDKIEEMATDDSSQCSLDNKSEALPIKNAKEESSAKPIQRGRPRISKESSVDKRAETPTDDSSQDSLDNNSEASPKKNDKSIRNSEGEIQSSPVLTKRKREISAPKRFVRYKTDDSSSSKSSSTDSIPANSPIKNGKPARAARSVQKSKLLLNHSTSPKVNNSVTKGSKDSKTQSRVNNIRNQQTNTRQKKNTEVKATAKRR